MNKWLQKFLKKEDMLKKTGSFRYVLIILAVGVALMLVSSFFSSEASEKNKQETLTVSNKEETAEQTESVSGSESSSPSSVIEYQQYYADELKEALEDVYGISDATVKVYIDTSKTRIVGRNRKVQSKTTKESDQQGGERTIEENSEDSEVVIINNKEGEKPLIIGTEAPEISGVAVVADGADNAQVELWIKDIVQSLLGIPQSRISVVPKKTKGE